MTASETWLVHAPGAVERIDARLAGRAFSRHRHDTYAIGITLEGVQSFDYRGSAWYSIPGQLVVLHPDELHDGRSGDDGAFRYRIAYLAPAEIQGVLGGCELPFVASAVSDDAGVRAPLTALLDDYARPLTAFAYQDLLYDLATALQALAGAARAIAAVHRDAANRARAFIHSRLEHDFSLADLERATGHDRWQLSRDFRALFGTSPYRYTIARRLDRARRMMLAGSTAGAAAHACGFADQSHFGRAFKKHFGLTPKTWAAAARPARSF
jgi:AraC-like DNA-binding protein